MDEIPAKIVKILSKNDTGENGNHQSGILVPKKLEILSFFPSLNKVEYNPRVRLCFMDEANKKWFFNFIYYNNKLFGGTRDEYRLTGLTPFFRENILSAGDKLILEKKKLGDFLIAYSRKEETVSIDRVASSVLRLGNAWATISLK
ncbi:MAG: EcoRII N-terminal effector-binding domain-containing protein [Candidatus Gracilibacteria bacterium]|nr:EcoRII N-terminal effector-binding domain-containing protein [Candidatus Gracilibacteria bacterium]